MGPAPVVPGQHFRPAANGSQPRPAGPNGFARPPRPQQQNGPLHFGNAAKGIRPSPSNGPRPPANDPQAKYQILRSMLNEKGTAPSQAKGEFVGGVFQPSASAQAPKPAASHLIPGQIPQIFPVQPRPLPRPMPAVQNGHPTAHPAEANGSTVNGARGGRARGRGRGGPGARGRGAPRGRGGHAAPE
jgi:hypothetical protein